MSLTRSPAACYDTIMVLTRAQDQRLKALEATPGARIDLTKAKFRKRLEPILWKRGWRPGGPTGWLFTVNNRRTFRATYVYAWYIGDEVVYVGQGAELRAWRGRGAEYGVMCMVPGFCVKILAYLHTATEARRVESAIINRWKPRFNKY